jgi:excinuclease UvrABC nuclease subunit
MPGDRKLRLKIPVISINQSEEEIYVPESSKPFASEEGRKGIALHPGDKDEAHRFAIP